MDHIWQALLTEKEKAYLKSLEKPPGFFYASSGMSLIYPRAYSKEFPKILFANMVRGMPNKYKQVREVLRWFVPAELRQDLITTIENRTTVSSSEVRLPDPQWREKVCCFGIPFVITPGLSVGILTYHDNWPDVKNPEALVVGFFAD